jgi:uncharacterized protein
VTLRRPLVVDASDALRHPGTRRPLQRDAQLGDLVLTGVRVPADGTVAVDLVVEAVGADVVVGGTVRAPWEGECRRCLEPVVGELELDVREVFERQPTEGETYPIDDDDQLDLEPMVREAVLLALPLSPVCRPDCRGPDPERFPAAAGEEDVQDVEMTVAGPGEVPDEHPPVRDPRWAALDELRLED